MPRINDPVRFKRERGQTIILVAISLVSLLAMAALAIDVVTLYVARSEIQRAADAAALAGAKAIADSGITTLNTNDLGSDVGIQALAQNMAISAINATLSVNLVAGRAPSLVGTPTFSFTTTSATNPINDPWVKVTLQQTGLPTFFARIFGKAGASTQASATAEAYNPSNLTPPLAEFTPIAPRCVKPWLVANADPTQHGRPFVSNGATENGVLQDPDFWLSADCAGAGSNCSPFHPPVANPFGAPYPNEVQYAPASLIAGANSVCPSAGAGNCGGSATSIQCCDATAYQYLNCAGSTGANAQWDNSVNPNGSDAADVQDAVQCLIHASGTGTGVGQDTIDYGSWPAAPFEIRPKGSGPPFVSTSSSIVTIPIIDTATFPMGGGNVTIVGFLQAFIEQVDSSSNIQIKVMNVIGCSNSPNTNATVIGGTGSSPIPIRLISP